jgi:hypothetical protein
VSSNKPKKAPKGDYAIGYARPPKANQFQPGQSGNLGGRLRDRPSLDELEQAVSSLNRLGFPNRHCSDSTCWLGGGQRGWPVHIRKTCATG